MAFQQGDLQATLTLKDFMTKELKKTQATVRRFASKASSGFSRIKGAVFSLKGALGALAIGAFARSAIQAFGVQEKAIAGLEQVMKSMGRFGNTVRKNSMSRRPSEKRQPTSTPGISLPSLATSATT